MLEFVGKKEWLLATVADIRLVNPPAPQSAALQGDIKGRGHA
jgi:hypothetical protein